MRVEIAIDENGYIYLIGADGKKRYFLVDVPNCPVYGKVKLGNPKDGDNDV